MTSDPFDNPLIRLGMAYQASGSGSEAIHAWKAALSEDPDQPAAHFLLGVDACDRGSWEEACGRFIRTFERSPTFVEALNNLGLVYWIQGDFASSTACWEKALARRPRFPSGLLNLGVAHMEAARSPEACRCFERVLSLDPRCSPALNNLGLWFWLEGHAVEAKRCLERAIALDGTAALPLRNLAEIFRLSGQEHEARHCQSLAALGQTGHGHRRGSFEWSLLLVRRIADPLEEIPEPARELQVYELEEDPAGGWSALE